MDDCRTLSEKKDTIYEHVCQGTKKIHNFEFVTFIFYSFQSIPGFNIRPVP